MSVNSTAHFVLSYTLVVATGLLLFAAISHILYQKRSAYSMISWLLAVVLLPHIAVPLYFLIGVRKVDPKRHKSDVFFDKISIDTKSTIEQTSPMKILEANDLPPASDQNTYRLITSGEGAYRQMLAEIENAKESIHISTYVFAHDEVTEKILDALTRKAKDGVNVYLLIDLVGSFGTFIRQKPFEELKSAGGNILFFTPILKKPLQNYINLRNHRKIYLFDRQIVLSGGMNLSREYMGPDPAPSRWQDIMYRLNGEAAYSFYTLFMNDWNYASAHEEPILEPETVTISEGNLIQFAPSGPDIPGDALYEALMSAIFEAKERIWVVTPYFVPSDSLMQALLIALDRGIDVSLITPKESNHLLADLGRSPYMRELYESGAHILLYTGDMLHAKAILVDHDIVMIGSVNFDNRSLFLNYEVVTFIYDIKIIRDIEEWIKELIDHTVTEHKKPTRIRESMENMMKVFAPLL